jgi:hypothetical protein
MVQAKALLEEAAKTSQPIDPTTLASIINICKNLAGRVAVEKREMTAAERRTAAKEFFQHFGIYQRS